MNNLTDFGGGSVLPSLAATKKSLSPWRLSKGFFLSTMGLLIAGISLIANSPEELADYYLKRFGDGGLRYFLEQQIIAAEIAKEKAY